MNNIKGEDKIVNIDIVIPNSWNPKEGVEENKENKQKYEEIKEEIRKKGLFEAITVRELGDEYEILDGFHRWTACKELGFTEIRINNLGVIDDKLARAITVIKEQKKVPISELKVAELVGWFDEQGVEDSDVMTLLGYDENTYEEYKKMFNFDWADYDVEFEESEVEDVEEQVDENNIIERRTLKVRLSAENYAKVRMDFETLGKIKFISKLVGA